MTIHLTDPTQGALRESVRDATGPKGECVNIPDDVLIPLYATMSKTEFGHLFYGGVDIHWAWKHDNLVVTVD